jgi:hypothetical protein
MDVDSIIVFKLLAKRASFYLNRLEFRRSESELPLQVGNSTDPLATFCYPD